MPRARCRYYDEHGAPINGGCRRIGTCGFIHPSEPGWMNAPLSRAMQPDAFSSGMGPPTGPRKRGRPDSGFGTSTTYQDSQPSLGDTTSGSSWGASGSSWTDSTSWQASSSSSARGNVSGSTTWGEAPKTTSSKWGNAAWIAAPTNTSSDWGDSSSGTAPADAWGTQPSGTYSGKGKHKESVGNDKSYARAAGETGSVKRKESANNEKKDTPSTGWGETSWGNDAWIGSKGDTENSSWGDSTAARHDSTTASGWQESTPARQDQPATPHWEGSPGPDRDDPMLSTWEAPAKTHPTESDPWTATHTSNDADLAQMDEMDQTDDSSLMPEEVHQSTSLHRTAEVFLTRPLSPPQPLSERDVNTKRGASPMSLSDLDTHVVAGSSRNLQRSGQSARSRSSSSTKSASVAGKRTFDHQDLIEALAKAVLYCVEFDEAETAYARFKALHRSKPYTKSAPATLERLQASHKERAVALSHARTRKDHAVSKVKVIADSCTPLALRLAELDDPIHSVHSSIDQVKEWCESASRILSKPADTRMAERSSSDLSPGVPTAQGSVALSAILHRLVTIEERVEDLERYQKQLYDDSRQMLEDHLDDRWNMAPSFVHPSSQDNEMYEAQAAQLRALKKPLDDVRGRVEDLQQEQRRQEPALEEMRTSNAELRERLTQLHKNNLAREQKLRDNAEKLDEMRARWEEAQWRISPGQLNPTVLFNQVGPLLLSALKEDVQISHEGIIRGIHDSLTEYQTRMLDAVWETLKPTIQLSTAIQQIMEEHSALKAKGDMTNPQVQAIATVATPDDSQTGSCLIH